MFNLLQYTGGEAETNAWLIPNPDGTHLCLDAPEGMAAFVRERKTKVSGLLLTHGHFDHVWDAALVAREHDCPVYAHPLDHAMILQPNYLHTFGISRTFPVLARLEPLEPPTEGAMAWSHSGHDFTLFHIPGHCPGSIAFYLEAQGCVFGGDVLFAEGIGRYDLPMGNGRQLLRGIREKLFPLPEPTVVYPGHGPSTTIGKEKGANPYFR